MFDEWKKYRKLKREIILLEKEESTLGENTNPKEKSELYSKLGDRHRKLSAIETDKILSKVQKLGIELPTGKKHWWWDDIDYEGEDFRNYLTDDGKAGVKKLIRNERRNSVDWWVKMIVSVLAALTGLIGSIIGVLAVLKK